MTEAYLTNILENKRKRLAEKKDYYYSLKWKTKMIARPHALRSVLSEHGQIKLIAEVKKASPSKGLIREDFDPVAIAKIYAESRASAISVLTEEEYFQGKPEFVRQIADAVKLPVLVKDFVIEDGQIYEAAANGASAVLLIAAILKNGQLKEMIKTAHELGLDCLVEVHNEQEIKRAVNAGAEIIGINNRDLFAFTVNMQTCTDLIPKVPQEKLIVAESGYKKYEEIRALKQMGCHGVLIGEMFMRAKDIGKKVKEVLYGAR